MRRRWPADPGAPGGRANRVGFEYDAYVPDEIAAWDPELPGSLAADAARVETAVRALSVHGAGLAVLTWPLLRAEATASSRIEGLAVSHHRLALASLAGADDPLAEAVLGNMAALRRSLDLAATPITPDALLEIHRALLAGTRDAPVGGRFRTGQNWIGGRHPNPRGADFVPPPEDDVPRLVDDLCRFCERDDIPVSLQAAIAHVQFETIHPFADGNGRVGRALIQVILHRRGLTTGPDRAHPVFPPVSLVLAASADAYVAGLTAFRAGDHRAWLRLFLDALHRATALAEDLAADVRRLQARWRAQAGHPRRHSAAEAIIARLPERPILDLAGAVALTGASREATRKALDRLESAGVLRELTGRRRLRRWEAVGLFELLDETERRAAGGTPRSVASLPTGIKAP